MDEDIMLDNTPVAAQNATSESIAPGYKQSDIGVIPEEWEVKLLREVTQIRSGIAKNSKALVIDPVTVKYLRVANVQDGFLDLSEVSSIVVDRSDLRRYSLLPGDVLMNEGGDLDKLGRGAIWNGQFNPCIHQNHVFVVRCGTAIEPTYLNNWSAGAVARNYFLLGGKQTTNLASINKTTLGNLPVVISPLPEQRAIAEALSDIDALIAALDTLIEKQRAIKQATMQQLLTGKTRLPGFSGAWETRRLGEVANFYKGLGLSKLDLTPDGEKRCIHYGELFTTYDERISKVVNGTNSNSASFYSQQNDVLMPTSDVTPNGLATASCITISGVILGGDILIIRVPDNIINGEFLAYSIKMNRSQIMQLISGTTVFHLYGRDMANFVFDTPQIEEQTAIATVLSDMDAEIAALEQRRDKTRHIKQGMMQQLLTGKIRLV